MNDFFPITWRQSGPTRWAGKDPDGYSLQVWESKSLWKWSLRAPSPAGYVIKHGEADSVEAAKQAVEAAYHWLFKEAPLHNPTAKKETR